MLENPLLIIELVRVFSVFGLVLSAWMAGMLLWHYLRSRRAKRIGTRLGLTNETAAGTRELHLWQDGTKATTTVPTEPHKHMLIDRLATESRQAGWRLSGVTMLLISVLAPLATLVAVGLLTRNLPLAFGLCGLVFVGFRIYVKHRIQQRDTHFERQLVDALELAARSLRAGHPLMGAFQLVSEEMRPPVSTLFAEICQRHEMGANVEEVLRDAADRSPNPHVKLFATSVAIQMKSGGNLANLMQRLAAVIRNRIRLSRRVRILTAQTQMSKRVLLVMPFVMFLLLTAINPDYMMPFYTTVVGRLMLAAGILLLAMGSWVMNRMAAINY